ncbi:helix-turn-helix domain-containing protein [Bradyrhizobium sp. SZCCHNR2032]|uniref:helix-turn-helix domain-containing protein n=1 Tax=Bradyrhizobium sp. SZCCHNR2032 TaxID=3057384 RepID=UPI002916DDDE|nr:helix-turn-helix domain-containing protein [Bradyrhizobium sp. SZCCHNR2032]
MSALTPLQSAILERREAAELRTLTVVPAQSLLADAAYPSMASIIKAVCQFYHVSALDIRSERRTSDVVRPRHLAMYFGKQLTPLSFPTIGRLLGGRDHTTVMHGARKIQRAMLLDADLAHDVAALFQIITGVQQ